MTNKTTIDGIDVSRCEFFTPTEVTVLGGGFETQIYCGQVNEFSDDAFTQNAPNLHCERCPNCHFKQLARAKEEIEKWKHQAELGSDTTDRLSKGLEDKNQEIEKLKSENFTFEELIKIQEKVIAKNEQALDEIEKIVDENLCEDDCDICPENCMCDWKEIKDIINKAKGVNNEK